MLLPVDKGTAAIVSAMRVAFSSSADQVPAASHRTPSARGARAPPPPPPDRGTRTASPVGQGKEIH